MNEMWQENVPPQDIEAEQAVLGAIFLDAEALVEAMAQIEPQDFYRRAHQIIFRSMIALNDRNENIDIITLKSQIESENTLEDVGGISYLTELSQVTPTASGVAHYAKIVKDKSTLRELIQAATKIVKEGYSQEGSVEEIVEAGRKRDFKCLGKA